MKGILDDLLKALAFVLHRAPVFLVQLTVTGFHPSRVNGGLLVLSFLFVVLLWQMTVLTLAVEKMAMVRRFIAQPEFAHSTFVRVPESDINEVVTGEMRASLYRGVFSDAVDRALGSRLDFISLNAYLIRPHGPDVLSDKLATYQSQLGFSFIFLRDSLKRANGRALGARQKFNFLHELGHTSKRAALDFKLQVARCTSVRHLVWIFFLFDWRGSHVAALVLIVLAQLTFRFDSNLWPASFSRSVLQSEMEADRWALRGLNAMELSSLSATLAKFPLLDDRLAKEFIWRGDMFRNYSLMRDIKTMRETGEMPELEAMDKVEREMFWVNLLSVAGVALSGQALTPLRFWVLGLAVSLIAALKVWTFKEAYQSSRRLELSLKERGLDAG